MEGKLNFNRITSVNDPLFANLYNLYSLAFPPRERRGWDGIEHELNYEKRFCPHALVQNDKFIGLLNCWTFDRFNYIEHIAIIPNLRNQHLGTEAMNIFMKQSKLPVILEVEMPNNIVASRRILFYERLGFSIISHNYAQPPYEGDGFLMPQLIMSTDLHFANTHFEKIRDTLYDNVYHYEHSVDKNTVPDD